jgi:hypothetical protein
MTIPDQIQITHQPRTMTTPRAALTSDDIPPGPLSEDDLRQRWNQQADEHNQWESLDSCEQLEWAQALAIKADRHAATPPAPEADPSHIDQLAAIIRRVDGNNSMGAAALAEAILERYPLAFLVDPPATQPALEPPSPSGYAYRYRSPFGGTCIRFNGGEEVNGGRPIEPVPYWFAPPSAPATPPAPKLGEVGELVEMLTQEAAILEAHCNKIANGECRTLACLQRGGYIRGTESPDSSVATCPELEKAVAKRRAATLLQQEEAELAALQVAPGPTFQDAIHLAEGCHDYSGGHSGAEGEA